LAEIGTVGDLVALYALLGSFLTQYRSTLATSKSATATREEIAAQTREEAAQEAKVLGLGTKIAAKAVRLSATEKENLLSAVAQLEGFLQSEKWYKLVGAGYDAKAVAISGIEGARALWDRLQSVKSTIEEGEIPYQRGLGEIHSMKANANTSAAASAKKVRESITKIKETLTKQEGEKARAKEKGSSSSSKKGSDLLKELSGV